MQNADWAVDPKRLVSIEGRWIILRPIITADYPELYRWRCDLSSVALWTGVTRGVPIFDDFVQELAGWLHGGVAMIVCDKKTKQPFGVRRAFNIDALNAHAYTQTYIVPRFRLRPHAAEAVLQFDDYLFRHFPFRKLFTEAYEFDEAFIRMLDRVGLEFEGRIKEKTWYDYRYWDVLTYSMSREAWQDIMEKWGTIMDIEDDIDNVQRALSFDATRTKRSN